MSTSTTTAPVAQPFSLRIERLSAGKSEALLGQADELEMRIKVYAEGGENELHAHLDHDHSFVVLDGEATFYDADGNGDRDRQEPRDHAAAWNALPVLQQRRGQPRAAARRRRTQAA